MIINDLTTKYTLANNWILRTDPYYNSSLNFPGPKRPWQ